jgi:hypothetical protein
MRLSWVHSLLFCFLMRFPFIALVLVAGSVLGSGQQVQAQKVKSVPFSYLPEQGEDRYNQRVPQKTLALADGTSFIALAHQSGSTYTVERYDANLTPTKVARISRYSRWAFLAAKRERLLC